MSRAVARLDGDGKARHVLYDRARGALINQLEARDPPFTKTEMMGERLELEDAIRLVEAETTRRQQQAPQPKTVSVARGPDGPPAKQERVPPLEKPASPQPSKQSVNLAPPQRSEAHSAQTQASGHDAPRGTSFADQHRPAPIRSPTRPGRRRRWQPAVFPLAADDSSRAAPTRPHGSQSRSAATASSAAKLALCGSRARCVAFPRAERTAARKSRLCGAAHATSKPCTIAGAREENRGESRAIE